jgi:hypothetical protein
LSTVQIKNTLLNAQRYHMKTIHENKGYWIISVLKNALAKDGMQTEQQKY